MAPKKYKDIDDYIADFPNDVQKLLREMRKVVLEAAPYAEESLFYNAPAFKHNGEILVQFAAFKKHIGFYPMESGINEFKKELSEYHIAKSTVRFPFDKPIPYNLVRKITKFRYSETK